jgi:uncharacterized protein (TIGR02266 family)
MDQPTSKEPRGPVSLRIKFRSASLDQFIERYAVDVSRGGIFIRTREPLAVGTQLRFDFQLQDAAPLLAGDGTIVWIRENDPTRAGVTPGMGVRFDKLTPASQPILEKILAEKARREQAGAPAKPGPAGGMAVRRPSSTFSALDPAARAQVSAPPPRVGGLSPLGTAPRPPAASPASSPAPSSMGAQPRSPAAPSGSGPVAGAQPRPAPAAPVAVSHESSGAFGRPRSTTGMNAIRPAPAPSSLFEKPSAEDIDRALSVLTEVDGPAPAPVPVPVDFSSRVRRPTDAQPMVVEAMPDVGSAPVPGHRRPTDAQPMVLESAPDVGKAPARRAETKPFFPGAGPATGETRAKTVPVMPLGDLSEEPLHDEEEEDDATSAWVGSGPTRVGEQAIPAAARGGKLDDVLGQAPTVVAKLGEGKLAEKPEPPKLPGRPSAAALPSVAAPPPFPTPPAPPPLSLDAAPTMAPGPVAPPAIMAPNFANEALNPETLKKKSSGATFAIVGLLLLGAGGGAYYFLVGPGKAMLSKSHPAATPAPTAEGTAPAAPEGAAGAAAAPTEPDKATEKAAAAALEGAKPTEAKPANAEAKEAEAKGGEAKPAEAKPAEAKPAEAKPAEAKPAEAKADEKPSEATGEGKPRRGKRRASGASEAAAPEAAAEAAPAVADVSPKPAGDKPASDTAKPEGEAAKPADGAKAEGGGHVLKITSSPPGAEVIVDGTSMGTTPFSSGDVDPALPHSVTIKKDGFEAFEHMISGSDWPGPKKGVRTLKLNAKLHSTGGEGAKPAEDSPSGEAAPGLGTTPASPKRE